MRERARGTCTVHGYGQLCALADSVCLPEGVGCIARLEHVVRTSRAQHGCPWGTMRVLRVLGGYLVGCWRVPNGYSTGTLMYNMLRVIA